MKLFLTNLKSCFKKPLFLTLIFSVLIGCIVILYSLAELKNPSPVVKAKSSVSSDEFLNGFISYRRYDVDTDLKDVAFQTEDNIDKKFSDFKGQYLLINFWATWCPPCVAELPSLQKADAQLDELELLAISFDMKNDNSTMERFRKKHNIENKSFYYDRKLEVKKSFPVRGLPTTLLVSPDLKILYRFEGHAEWDSPQALAFLRSVIAGEK
jgi:thiol-disulfide isomerase/thioredoxin